SPATAIVGPRAGSPALEIARPPSLTDPTSQEEERMNELRIDRAERTSRRDFVKTAGVGGASAALLTILDARQAPAQIKGTTLRLLQWSHFVPAYDTWFDNFVKEWGDKNGVKVRVDRIPHLELPSRIAAEFAAGTGHDLIYFVGTILTG